MMFASSAVSISSTDSYGSLNSASFTHTRSHANSGATYEKDNSSSSSQRRRRHLSTPVDDRMTSRRDSKVTRLRRHSGRTRDPDYTGTKLTKKMFRLSPEEIIGPMHKRGFQFKEVFVSLNQLSDLHILVMQHEHELVHM